MPPEQPSAVLGLGGAAGFLHPMAWTSQSQGSLWATKAVLQFLGCEIPAAPAWSGCCKHGVACVSGRAPHCGLGASSLSIT